MINSNWCRWSLEKDPIFTKLTKIQVEKIIKNVEFKNCPPGEVVLSSGKPLTHLAMIINGDVNYGSKSYQKGFAFSSEFIYPDSRIGTTLSHDLLSATENTRVALLDIQKFYQIIGGTMEKAMIKNEASHEVKIQSF